MSTQSGLRYFASSLRHPPTQLRNCAVFSQIDIPEFIVTDNGICFVSDEFRSFLHANGVRLITSAPYHPLSNGFIEWAVQILKKGLKKVYNGSTNTRLAKILFSYRLTPQSTTVEVPTELLLGRRPRSRLDLGLIWQRG